MPSPNALAILEPPPRGIGKMKAGDRDIWLMKKRGWTTEQLSHRFGKTESQITAACDRYDLYKAGYDNDAIDLELNKMAMKLMPNAQKVLADGMKATVDKNVGRGQKVMMRKVVDHATRMKAVEIAKSLMETSRPKGVGLQLNQQFNANNPQQPVATGAKNFDFESRVRQILEAKGLTDKGEIQDAEYEDGEERDELGEELAELGIELDDDDEDDEDDE